MVEKHERGSSAHWRCDDCGRDFVSSRALLAHYRRSPNHHYCRECDRHFRAAHNLRWHLNSRLHHSRVHQSESSDRHFQTKKHLRHHLDSRAQQANLCCPGRGCNRSFASPTHLTIHFEAGTCPSGMTCEKLNRLVVRADVNNYITDPSRLVTGTQGWNEPPAPIRATKQAWNGQAYECILCHSTFRNLGSLSRHLKSSRHVNKIYRCPKSDCKIAFSTLSALCQHVEGGSCGVKMFKHVRDTIDGFTKGFNLLTV